MGTPAQSMLMAADTSNDAAWPLVVGVRVALQVFCSILPSQLASRPLIAKLLCASSHPAHPQLHRRFELRPVVAPAPNPEPVLVHALVLLAQFQVRQLLRVSSAWAGGRSSLYYVNLMGMRVGSKIVDIPPSALAFNATTGARTIFDSGTRPRLASQ
ncbi:hypothetical protein NL676_005171 [Syzygium grande]|nr:hypothetical protein NL676_005171 [Syzygium grande]